MRSLLFAAALLASPALAEEATPPRPDKAALDKAASATSGPLALKEAKGTVEKVDWMKSEIVVKQESGSLALRVDRNSTVFADNRVGTFRDVRVGAELRAGYEERLGLNRAQWIEVKKREGAAEAPPAVDGGPAK